jgi:hypothetical protein
MWYHIVSYTRKSTLQQLKAMLKKVKLMPFTLPVCSLPAVAVVSHMMLQIMSLQWYRYNRENVQYNISIKTNIAYKLDKWLVRVAGRPIPSKRTTSSIVLALVSSISLNATRRSEKMNTSTDHNGHNLASRFISANFFLKSCCRTVAESREDR